MSKKLYIETNVRSLSNYLDDIRTGILQIPAFQRDFVWKRDAVKDLFDSIKNNYPIGSVLLWKPENPNWDNKKTIGAYYILSNKTNPIYILDGFQRFSCLFGCLTNPNSIDLKRNETEYKAFFDLYYDLEDEAFIYLRSEANRSVWQLPVYILMSSKDFRQYSRTVMEPGITSPKIDLYLDRADRLSSTLLDYKIANIEIKNANIEEAVKIFSRINSRGADISFDWMVNALSFSSDFQFAKLIDNLLDELREYNFEKIKRDAIFRCIQSSFGKYYIDQTNIEELAYRTDFPSVTKKIIPIIKRAIIFLHDDLMVLDSKLLPYNIQLIFITDFFEKIHNPSESQLADLKNWFWCTTYSNYFTIYSLSNQRKAYEHFHNYLNGESCSMLYNDDLNLKFDTASFPEKISMGSVRAKALVLFLLNKQLKKNRKIYGYYFQKIFLSSSDAANIIPIIEDKNTITYKFKKDLSSWLNQKEKIDIDDYFLTRNVVKQNDDKEKIINERRKWIQKEECEFVQSIGLKYTES